MTDDGPTRFRQLIAADREEEALTDPDAILQPLEDLVAALREAGVGADVVRTSFDRRNLVMWPQHRPARRTSMLTFAPAQGEPGWHAMMRGGPRLVNTPQKTRELLEEFVGLPTFRQSIRELREQETWDVEGILVGRDGSTRMLRVPANGQAMLDQIRSSEATVDLDLDQGEVLPVGFEPMSLDSAGLRFRVRDVLPSGRRLRLTLERVE